MNRVYVGSLWHHNCDPFGTVFARTEEICQRKLDHLAENEYQNVVDTTEPEFEPEDDIMTGGVFEESVNSAAEQLDPEHWEELKSDGYTIL